MSIRIVSPVARIIKWINLRGNKADQRVNPLLGNGPRMRKGRFPLSGRFHRSFREAQIGVLSGRDGRREIPLHRVKTSPPLRRRAGFPSGVADVLRIYRAVFNRKWSRVTSRPGRGPHSAVFTVSADKGGEIVSFFPAGSSGSSKMKYRYVPSFSLRRHNRSKGGIWAAEASQIA